MDGFLLNLSLGKDFLPKTQNPNIIKEKIGQFDYSKNHELVKRQVKNWKKILVYHKELISLEYKELLKDPKPDRKMGNINRQFKNESKNSS